MTNDGIVNLRNCRPDASPDEIVTARRGHLKKLLEV